MTAPSPDPHTAPEDTTDDPTEYPQARFVPPPGCTELLLVRHGESEPTRLDRPHPLVDGHSDPALTEEGQLQARRVADRLRLEHVDVIYVSTLRRTHQTAAPLAEALSLRPRVEPDLREVHLGTWEAGLYRKMVAERHPTAVRMWTDERWDAIPEAESNEAFAARVRTAVEKLAASHPDQRLAVFTHGGVIGQALATASGSTPFAFVGADNGSISHLVITAEGRWIVRRYNDTAHLHPSFTLAAAPLT